MAKYELKGIKEAGGDETPRFEASIYCDGVKIAVVSNGGHGGCCDYYFTPREAEAAFQAHCKAWWDASEEKQEHIRRFKEYGLDDDAGSNSEMDDSWVYAEMEVAAHRKRLKRASKTKCLFILKGDEKYSYRSLNKPYSPAAVAWLTAKYGDKIETIIDPATL